ncbi:NADH oxidoreductase [Algimonas ampicilliniresistens]|uniref:NADH oxidoreductase n=1 Tax=Algimonas ampicilliniresistens TaxID=1298735 RepID=A0ABQ5V6I5_9PROT|nr:zinc-binding dehydrogenase [Algimonas ampicilliniresistens]GLQ22690.1 NADH oxidoreductase [Algimonas ampicilliniresistens]
MSLPKTYKTLISTVTEDGQLRMEMVEKPMPVPKSDQVLIRVEAAPINPSDHGVMFGYSDMSKASNEDGALVAPIPPMGMRMMKGRLGQALPIGNEGAGTVVAAGDSDAAQSLMGRTVAAMGGGMYTQYRVVPVMQVLPINEGNTARDGASSFVNPLTALCFPETMRNEGHTAIVHTAAASNLGQMLVKICKADGVPLVNIVRKDEQVALLKSIGATHVINSSDDDFIPQLIDAVHETGATLAFDATGGGRLASDILTAMEGAAARTPGAYSIYGSIHHKQVYLYGSLDPSPTMLTRGYGMAWGVGGWLLPNFLAKAGMETAIRLRQRVANELTTTFASTYTDEISLADALNADIVARYNAKKTGEKFLVNPQL